MTTSDSIAQLATALSVAQGEMKPALKDSENPHFRSKYADLAAVWDACREPLARNGLAVVQTLHSQGASLSVVTLLAHKSGEWVRGDLTVPVGQPNAQALGSAATYARRYCLASIVGVAPDDDDGHAASAPAPAPPPRRAQVRAIVEPDNDLPWKTWREMVNAFQLAGSVVGEGDFHAVLRAHNIPEDFTWPPDKRPPKLKAAYAALQDLALLGGPKEIA